MSMKFLCLAYCSEKDWLDLSKQEQEELLANDEVLRRRGDLVMAVQPDVATVTAWDGRPKVTNQTFSTLRHPLAGFAVIEADNIDEVIRLVANTPCARANGAIEIRPFLQPEVV
jgi:hypothetical protein